MYVNVCNRSRKRTGKGDRAAGNYKNTYFAYKKIKKAIRGQITESQNGRGWKGPLWVT